MPVGIGGVGLRISVRVRTGVSRPSVGGRYGTDAVLIAVAARPVDGAANRAVETALAGAFGVAPRDVAIVAGAASRTKTVLIAGEPEALRVRLAELLDE